MANHRNITRITYETLAAGQPRPYADSVYRYRVTFERQWKTNEFELRPWEISRDVAIRELSRLPIGFIPPDQKPEGWWSSRLDYLTEISPGVWEFQTHSPYTD